MSTPLLRAKTARFVKVCNDFGFKTTFTRHCRHHHIAAETVNCIHPHAFVALPRRWVVERTWSWLMNNCRLHVEDEHDPNVTEGFIWAVHSRRDAVLSA